MKPKQSAMENNTGTPTIDVVLGSGTLPALPITTPTTQTTPVDEELLGPSGTAPVVAITTPTTQTTPVDEELLGSSGTAPVVPITKP